MEGIFSLPFVSNGFPCIQKYHSFILRNASEKGFRVVPCHVSTTIPLPYHIQIFEEDGNLKKKDTNLNKNCKTAVEEVPSNMKISKQQGLHLSVFLFRKHKQDHDVSKLTAS